MNLTDLAGFVAGALTSCSIFPQVIRIYRLRSGNDISYTTYLTSAIGLGFWIFYGLRVNKTPVIIWNSVGFVLCLTVLYLKVHYSRRKND